MSGLAGYAFLEGLEQKTELLRSAGARFSGPNHDIQIHADADFGAVVASRFDNGRGRGSFAEIHESERQVLACEGYIVNLDDLAGAPAPKEGRGALLLGLYRRYGDDLFARLNGGYSLALWDKAEKRLVLHVAKFGQRRLFRASAGEGVFFGSEIPILPLLSGRPLAPDPVGLSSNLLAGANYGTTTCFAGVRRLFQGSVVTLTRGGERTFLPELMPREAARSSAPVEDLADQLDGLMRQSVGRLLGLHPSHAVLLSSGADSALVAAYTREISGELTTITQGMPGGDESASAGRIAGHLGSKHHGFPYQVDGRALLDGIETLVRIVGEPGWAQLGLPLTSISTVASRIARTFSSGVGGDALFGSRSYESFDDTRQRLFDYVPQPYDPGGVRLIVRLPFDNQDDFVSLLAPLLPSRPFDRYAVSQVMGFMSRHVIGTGSALAQQLGAEALYPYLDDNVVRFSFTLPDELKANDQETKALLRRVLDRYVPRPLIPQGKRGYWAEALTWCYEADSLGPALDLLSEPRTLEREIYNRANLEKLIAKYRSRQAEEGWHRILWQILSLEIFLRQLSDSRAVGA